MLGREALYCMCYIPPSNGYVRTFTLDRAVLRTHWRLISNIERIADNLLIIAAFFLTYHLRDQVVIAAGHIALNVAQEFRSLGDLQDYFVVLGFALPLFNAALALSGAYRSMRLSTLGQLFRISAVSGAIVFLCLGAVLYFLKLDLSRSFVGLFCLHAALACFFERIGVLMLLRILRLRGRNYRNVLVVGTGSQARKLYFEIMGQPDLGIRIAGFVSMTVSDPALGGAGDCPGTSEESAADSPSAVYDLPARVVADRYSFEGALKRFAVDEVLFTEVSHHFSLVAELAQIAVEEGVGVSLAADLFSLEILKSDIAYFGSIPLLQYRPTPETSALVTKRLIDLGVSSLLLLLLSPLMVVTALLIKSGSPGPVFFRQRRVGLNGRIFTLLKFRSMVEDAESMLETLREHNEMRGPVFKMKDDPRVTPLGRFLRRWSIDELPQLINVFRGDMSLVGPRPPLPGEVSSYRRDQRRRLSMRPGLTCIWQVSGRNQIPDFEEWAKLDLEYIDNWSLLNDFKLLLRTIPAVLGGIGAE